VPLNNEYKRFFIILQEDDKGYEMAAGKIPTGYVKIEIKNGRGKLTAYVQNVKSAENIHYRLLLIAPTKKAAVDMGRLMVDGNGRGELNVEFEAENVLRSGMEISDFMVAAISTNTSTPLSGYTGRDKVQWKNGYHIVNKPQDRIDKKAMKVEEVKAPVQAQPVQMSQPAEVSMPQLPKMDVEDAIDSAGAKDVVGDVVEGHKNVVYQVTEFIIDEDEVKPMQQKPVEMPISYQPIPFAPQPMVNPIEMMPQKPLFEMETESNAKFIIQQEMPKPQKQAPKMDYKDYYYDEDCDSDSDSDSDSDDKVKHKEHGGHEENEWCHEDPMFQQSSMYRCLEKVLGRLKDCEPFDGKGSREKWFKVGDDIYLLNSATIPFMGALMPLGYPFMTHECVMMIGQRDYIIGVKHDRDHKDKKSIKTVMFGIPGTNSKQEERYFTMRGFIHFRPHKSKNHGYWIMMVDLSSGEIIVK
jgi:hypothetical protein